MFSLPNDLPLSFIWWRIVTMIMCVIRIIFVRQEKLRKEGSVWRCNAPISLTQFMLVCRQIHQCQDFKRFGWLRPLSRSSYIKIIFVVKSTNPTQSNARILRALIRIIFARLEGRKEVYGGGSHQLVWLHCLQMNLSPQHWAVSSALWCSIIVFYNSVL